MKITAQKAWEKHASQRGYSTKMNIQTVRTDPNSLTAWLNFLAGFRAAIKATRPKPRGKKGSVK